MITNVFTVIILNNNHSFIKPLWENSFSELHMQNYNQLFAAAVVELADLRFGCWKAYYIISRPLYCIVSLSCCSNKWIIHSTKCHELMTCEHASGKQRFSWIGIMQLVYFSVTKEKWSLSDNCGRKCEGWLQSLWHCERLLHLIIRVLCEKDQTFKRKHEMNQSM